MSPYTPNDAFTPGDIYDLSDLVKGGLGGDANTPIQAILDQTNYLKNRLTRWTGFRTITDNYAIIANDIGQWIQFVISDNKTLTLPDVTALAPGTRIGIGAIISAVKALTVQAFNNEQAIRDGNISWKKWDDPAYPAIYLHDTDTLTLIAASTLWLVEDAKGNFYTAGDSFPSRLQRGNTFVANGNAYNRQDIPRVTLFALSLEDSNGIVSDAVWLSDPAGPWYRGLYSFGDGVNTIRVPDERGLSDRYLDLGRGLDTNRLVNFAGGYEEEQVAAHDHVTHGKGKIPSQNPITGGYLNISDTPITGRRYSGGGLDPLGLGAAPDTTMRTSNNSGGQNIVKNIGKIPLIPY